MREGWREAKLGDLFEPSNARLGEHVAEPVVFSVSKYDGVIPAHDFFGKRIASANLAAYKKLPAEDWVYSTIHIDEGSIAHNKTGVDGVVSPMYTVMKWVSPLDDPLYVEHLLRSREMLAVYADNAQGSINRRRSLAWRSFEQIKVRLPPLAEQYRIVDLIAAIDQAAEAANNEAAAGLSSVSSLVAAGVERADAKKVKRLGEVMTIVRGGSPRPIASYETQHLDGYPWIKIGDISADGMYVDSTATRIRAEGLSKTRLIHPGDFILSNSMSFGRPYISRITGCIHDGWLALSDYSHALDAQFLYYLLRGADVQAQFASLAAGSGVKNLKKDSVASVKVGLPSIEIQREIVARATAAREVADAARTHADALRTLRSNLIAVLLSGEHEIPSSYDHLLNVDMESAP